MTINELKAILRKAADLANKEWADTIENKFKKISHDVVKEFYDDYPQRKYVPYGNLYQSYHVEKGRKGSYIILYLDSKMMDEHYSRNANADYIYNLTMVHGWHGGANKGAGHPNPGDPYWRTPAPEYTYWGEMAESANFSPEEVISERLDKEVNSEQLAEDLFYKYINKLL